MIVIVIACNFQDEV